MKVSLQSDGEREVETDQMICQIFSDLKNVLSVQFVVCTCGSVDGDVAGRESLCGHTGVSHKQQRQHAVSAGDGWRHRTPAVPVRRQPPTNQYRY